MQSLTRQHARLPAAPPPRILQFGGGNFLRAYFDWMVDRMNERTGFNGGVTVVKPTAGGDYRELRAQDGLFHVALEGVRQGETVKEFRLVSCVGQVVHPYREYAAYLRTAEDEGIRYVVSNTTEAGIRFVEEEWSADRCATEYPGKLTQWLHRRWASGGPGCHLLPLELIEENGAELRRCVLKYAAYWQLPADFAEWIKVKNHFYDTLVDRIVSGYPPSAEEVLAGSGYRDELLVAGEHYHSLIVKAPKTGIPGLPLGEAGIQVTYTDELGPYRERKVRLLNGAHTAIVPTGYLAGLNTVGEVMADPNMQAYLEQVLYREIIPSLDQDVGELRAFATEVMDRFRNPSIRHKLLDISLNSTTKFRTRLLPSLLTYHRKFGEWPVGIVRALAALIVFYRGRRGAEEIPLRDAADRIEYFRQQWSASLGRRELTERILSRTDWWGEELSAYPRLLTAVSEQIGELR